MPILRYFYNPNPPKVTKFLVLFFLSLYFFTCSFAQTPQDSANSKKDSIPLKLQSVIKDSISGDSLLLTPVVKKRPRPAKKDSSLTARQDSISAKKALVLKNAPALADSISPVNEISRPKDFLSGYQRKALSENPYFNFTGKPMTEPMEIRQRNSSDALFYFLVGILFYFALIKLLFDKYLKNLFTLFFRISMRQQQIREQVLQTPLPSLLLNILFIVAAGLYASFLIRYYHLAGKIDFWILSLDCAAILCILYLAKFLVLKFSGWIFNIKRATDRYIFIIFLANKIFGIFLLPFLLILAVSGSLVKDIMVTVSIVMAFIFFVYRFIVSYNPIRKEIKVNGFHFFLYLCAFEVAPLLLIYKVLLTYLEKAY
jgi:Domain of unknown function (DUF4271)